MTPATPIVFVAADPAADAALRERAESLARELGLVVGTLQNRSRRASEDVRTSLAGRGDRSPADLALVVTPTRLELRVLRGDLAGGHAVAPEFEAIDVTSGPGRSLRQPLFRAAGIRKGEPYRPTVIDATAGLGEDAYLLASAGCRVTCVERHPIIAAMLSDAFERSNVADRVAVVRGDAKHYLATLDEAQRPDVVYLDPMFPGHAKRKAAERKPLKVLRLLAGADEDADALLEPALRAAKRRAVVKRPSHAPPLAGREPMATHEGKGVRWDVYAVN